MRDFLLDPWHICVAAGFAAGFFCGVVSVTVEDALRRWARSSRGKVDL